PVYANIFGEHMKKLKDAYFERHKKAISRGVQGLVGVLTGNEGGFSAAELEQARTAKTTLLETYGFREDSARDLVVQMARVRYRWPLVSAASGCAAASGRR